MSKRPSRLSRRILPGAFVLTLLMGPGCISDPFALDNRNRLPLPMFEPAPAQTAQTATDPITPENAHARCQALLDEVERELQELPQ